MNVDVTHKEFRFQNNSVTKKCHIDNLLLKQPKLIAFFSYEILIPQACHLVTVGTITVFFFNCKPKHFRCMKISEKHKT